MCKTIKKLHIPVPSVRCWSKRAAKGPAPIKPPLPEVVGLISRVGASEPNGTGSVQEPIAVPPKLLARYNREELYEKVWMMPLWKVAEEYRASRPGIVATCKGLHVPTPPEGYWSKKAANKPVPVKPPLPEILGLIGQIGPAEISGTGTVQEPLIVSAGLMSRYNREELYEAAWEVPMLKLAKRYGVSNEALGKTCRKLHVPVPGRGYWNRITANKSVAPKPPLPKVQIQ
jgi:hypothetical protein